MKYGRRRNGRRKRSKLKRKRVMRKRRVSRRTGRGPMRVLSGNLPLGRKLKASLSWTQMANIPGDGILSTVTSATYVANGLNQITIATDGTVDNRAAGFLAEQFTRYTVRGMKYHLSMEYTEGIQEPAYMFFTPWTPGNSLTTADRNNIGSLVQHNGCKWRHLPNRSGDRARGVLKGYINVAKMTGKPTSETNLFEGTSSGPNGARFWVNPNFPISYSFGWGSSRQFVTPTNNYVSYILKTTYYVDFYDPSVFGVE